MERQGKREKAEMCMLGSLYSFTFEGRVVFLSGNTKGYPIPSETKVSGPSMAMESVNSFCVQLTN